MRREVVIKRNGEEVRMMAEVIEEGGLLYVVEDKGIFGEIPQAELEKLDRTLMVSKSGSLIVTVIGCRSDKETLKKMRNILRNRDFEIISPGKRIHKGKIVLEAQKVSSYEYEVENLKKLGFKEV